MKQLGYTIFFLLLYSHLAAQSDTLKYYFDKDMNIVSKESADFMAIGIKKNGKLHFTTYRHPAGRIIMKGYFLDSTLAVRDGLFTYYDSLGATESEGIYVNNAEEGYWVNWTENTVDSTLYKKAISIHRITLTFQPGNRKPSSRTYRNISSLAGETMNWDTVGNLISKIIWDTGVEEHFRYHLNGQLKEYERKAVHEKPRSRYYSEDGKDITKQVLKERGKPEAEKDNSVFAGGEGRPSFPGGRKSFFDFIQRNLRIPERTAATGSTGEFLILSFMLNKSGYARDILVEGGLVDMRIEAASILRRMPAWRMNGMDNYGPIKISLDISIIRHGNF